MCLCVYICRKEDYLAVKILIRNKLKKKIRGTEPFSGVVLEFGSFVCFGWLFFYHRSRKSFKCQVYKTVKE